MSSVPFYAVNTSCRTAECPRSPFRVKKIQHEESRRRTQSLSESPPASPVSPKPQISTLQLPDARIRSSSLNHLQKFNAQQQTQQQQQTLTVSRERFMEALGVFN